MDLISCKNCGVVLDKDELIFPFKGLVEVDRYTELAAPHLPAGVRVGEEIVPVLPCPVCCHVVPQTED